LVAKRSYCGPICLFFLRFNLNWLKQEIRKDLETRRSVRSPLRHEHLARTLAEVAT